MIVWDFVPRFYFRRAGSEFVVKEPCLLSVSTADAVQGLPYVPGRPLPDHQL